MKKIKYLLIIITTVMLFASCSDEGDDWGDGAKESGLVGTWVWDNDNRGSGDYSEEIITFKSNLTGIAVSNWYDEGLLLETQTETAKFTWSVDGDKLSYVFVEGDNFSFLYGSPCYYYYYYGGDELLITNTKDNTGGMFYKKM